MGTLIAKFLGPYEVYLWAAGAIAILGWGLWAVHHERDIGRQEVIAADAAARADEDRKNATLVAQWTAKATQAENEREIAQKTFDSYMSAHPVGHLFVCGPSGHNGAVSSAPGAVVSNAGAGTGPDAVPEVPTGSDIGGALDSIMQAAGRMGELYREYQGWPGYGPVTTVKQ
jgi:hypothetical protein